MLTNEACKTCLDLLSQVRICPTDVDADNQWMLARSAVEELRTCITRNNTPVVTAPSEALENKVCGRRNPGRKAKR